MVRSNLLFLSLNVKQVHACMDLGEDTVTSSEKDTATPRENDAVAMEM